MYYALQAIPYSLVGGTLLERLAIMRLLSALMARITALFVFLFIREALPGIAWAWTAGALGVALAPLLGFMSSGVNPDAMLYAVSVTLSTAWRAHSGAASPLVSRSRSEPPSASGWPRSSTSSGSRPARSSACSS
jgi:hypothetical protein